MATPVSVPLLAHFAALSDPRQHAKVSAQGQLRFMLTKGRVTAAVFMDFLKRLLVNARTPSGGSSRRKSRRSTASQRGSMSLASTV
jgi:hypothetical protein